MPSPKEFSQVPIAVLQADIANAQKCIDTIMADGTGTASYNMNGMSINRTNLQTVIDNRNAMYTALAKKTGQAVTEANPVVHRRY